MSLESDFAGHAPLEILLKQIGSIINEVEFNHELIFSFFNIENILEYIDSF